MSPKALKTLEGWTSIQSREGKEESAAACWLFGLHAVEAALRHDPEHVLRILMAQGRRDARMSRLEQQAQRLGLPITRVEVRELERLTGSEHHQGVAVQYRPPPSFSEHDLYNLLDHLNEPPLLLVLDGVTDPHNLGACLRVADGAGAHAVIAPKDRAVGLTPTVRKVASGAAGSVPFVQVTNLARTLEALKLRGLWVIGLAGEADHSLYATSLAMQPLALVMGAEGAGLRRLTREVCDELVSLPMWGKVESLNVAVATGISLYEIRRQRLQNG